MPARAICLLSQSCYLDTSSLYLNLLLLTWAGRANKGRAKVLQVAKTVELLPDWEAQVLSRAQSFNLWVETHH